MSSSEYWLESERLGLRRFGMDDLDWLCELYNDADVTRYLGGTKTRAQVEEMAVGAGFKEVREVELEQPLYAAFAAVKD